MPGYAPPKCCVDGCPGELVPTPAPPSKPDHWVRMTAVDGWGCSEQPPGFGERPGHLGYRCARCGETKRLVEPAPRGARG